VSIPPDQPRDSIRMDARLDAMTRAKVDALATRFHRPRAAVLIQIMQWGLSRGQIGSLEQGDAQGPVRHLSLYVVSELYARVQQAATAAGVKTASWLRHMVRQVTITDVPKSWEEEQSEKRFHDSCTYGTRFMLRLDEPSREQLQHLVERFDVSKAEIIRQLIAQATPEDFPKSWHMRAAERRAQQARQNRTGKSPEPKP
jgi:predicted transcriptional regulator